MGRVYVCARAEHRACFERMLPVFRSGADLPLVQSTSLLISDRERGMDKEGTCLGLYTDLGELAIQCCS